MKEIKIKSADEIIYEHTCKNGLKVYIWKYDLSEEISLSFTVKYGSIHTDFKVGDKSYHVPNGVAHFLEHIKFNETKEETAHTFYNKMGSYTNAYTTFDHTCYEVICNNNLKENLEHLLFFVLNPYFTKKMIVKEKPIIIEEAKSTLDNPYNIGFFKLLSNIYVNNKHKNLITGTPEEIKQISYDDILNVFNNFYNPKNMFLTVTGNVNPFEVQKIVDEYFDNNKAPKNQKCEIISEKEPLDIVKEKEIISVNVTKEKLLLGYKLLKKNFRKYDDLHIRVLFNILLDINFGVTSLFNEKLISNNIIDDLFFTINVDEDAILLLFESSTSYPSELALQIKEKMNNLDFDEADFKRKINLLIANTILGYDSASYVNSDIVNDIIKNQRIVDDIAEIYKSLKQEDLETFKNQIKKAKVSEVVLKPNK